MDFSLDLAIQQVYDSFSMSSDALAVGNYNEGFALLMQTLKNR